jgi:hypothetical protein
MSALFFSHTEKTAMYFSSSYEQIVSACECGLSNEGVIDCIKQYISIPNYFNPKNLVNVSAENIHSLDDAFNELRKMGYLLTVSYERQRVITVQLKKY